MAYLHSHQRHSHRSQRSTHVHTRPAHPLHRSLRHWRDYIHSQWRTYLTHPWQQPIMFGTGHCQCLNRSVCRCGQVLGDKSGGAAGCPKGRWRRVGIQSLNLVVVWLYVMSHTNLAEFLSVFLFALDFLHEDFRRV